MTTPTLGAQRVRLDFNPSSNTAVDRIKRAGAVLIDAVNDEAGDGCSPCSGLIPCRRSITDAAGGGVRYAGDAPCVAAGPPRRRSTAGIASDARFLP